MHGTSRRGHAMELSHRDVFQIGEGVSKVFQSPGPPIQSNYSFVVLRIKLGWAPCPHAGSDLCLQTRQDKRPTIPLTNRRKAIEEPSSSEWRRERAAPSRPLNSTSARLSRPRPYLRKEMLRSIVPPAGICADAMPRQDVDHRAMPGPQRTLPSIVVKRMDEDGCGAGPIKPATERSKRQSALGA